MPPLLYQVDAFTSTPFAGNPAAVCVLSAPRAPDWMQRVAGEMNLSETAFLHPQEEGTYRLRWFTPTHEVDLCGHATLATAHVLWADGVLAPEAPARFDTRSGRLTARREGDWTYMDFPTDPVEPVDPPTPLLEGLGAPSAEEIVWSGRDYLVRLSEAQAVRALEPNLQALATLDEARGVIVTAPFPTDGTQLQPPTGNADTVDFVSRFFAPAVGVPEDPVTGSSHCALGPYWAAQTGRTTLTGWQMSDRGGTVRVHLDAPNADRVTLGGRATVVVRGRLVAGPLDSAPTSPDAG